MSTRLSAEGATDGAPDVFVAPLRFEMGQIVYVLLRDQLLWPLLQGKVFLSWFNLVGLALGVANDSVFNRFISLLFFHITGVVWGVGGTFLGQFWAWNKARNHSPTRGTYGSSMKAEAVATVQNSASLFHSVG